MENRVHLYVSRQNFFTRLASVLLMYSLVARVVVFGFTKHAGTVGFWGQIVGSTSSSTPTVGVCKPFFER